MHSLFSAFSARALLPFSLLLTIAGGTVGCASANDGGNVVLQRGDGSFDHLTLGSFGGMPGPSNAADECASGGNIDVDVPSMTVAWFSCEYSTALQHNVRVHGSRAISAAELATVRAGFQQLVVGTDGGCGADASITTLDVVVDGVTALYQDDFYACLPPRDGRTFVRNIEVVEGPMAALLPRSTP